jgi:hypothetical protein
MADTNEHRINDEQVRCRQDSDVRQRSFSIQSDLNNNNLNYPDGQITLVQVRNEEYESGYDEDDIISLPPLTNFFNVHRHRSKTITSSSENNLTDGDVQHHYEGQRTWGSISDQNDEYEREPFVCYVQRNSHMMLAGVVKQTNLNDEYLQNLVKTFELIHENI